MGRGGADTKGGGIRNKRKGVAEGGHRSLFTTEAGKDGRHLFQAPEPVEGFEKETNDWNGKENKVGQGEVKGSNMRSGDVCASWLQLNSSTIARLWPADVR